MFFDSPIKPLRTPRKTSTIHCLINYQSSYHGTLTNKYSIALGSILTPLVAIMAQYANDFVFMILALIIFVTVDTVMGIYIAIKEGKLSSDKGGFWKIGDKLVSYFGLVALTYTIVIVVQLVPMVGNGISTDTLKYVIYFSFSAMYGRETFSILESIDKLQPKLLPAWLKKRIANMFKRSEQDKLNYKK